MDYSLSYHHIASQFNTSQFFELAIDIALIRDSTKLYCFFLIIIQWFLYVTKCPVELVICVLEESLEKYCGYVSYITLHGKFPQE